MTRDFKSDDFATIENLRLEGAAQAEFHERARAARSAIFQNHVFIRAVVEVSNYCRENCHYCGMRRDNHSLDRFRLDPDAVAENLLDSLPKSVTDLDIQSGEDPKSARELTLPLIRRLKQERPELGITVCLGCLDFRTYEEL